ncbi:hypothetical protein [Halorubrum sp. DTA46]|uniref:hypothetical protein n=1 Tax=Halorubrum sp. DTA46 TaxID=3402162 RepID=UPI003AACD493
MQRTRVVAALLVVVAAGLALSGFFSDGLEERPVVEVDDDALMAIDGDYRVWQYTSRSESPEGRTLAINVVFHGDGETVRETLEARPDAEWEETDEEASDADPELVSEIATRDWEDAHGSTRYTYFEGPDGGEWVTESFELHDGEYLGSRDHIRAYESPDGAYTAVQIHEEYYDWFRLRHTVPDINDPAVRLEDDFIESNGGESVSREYRGIEEGLSDGWITVIELALLVSVTGALLGRQTKTAAREFARRARGEAARHADAALLGAALAAVFIGVRVAGIAIEVAYPSLPPKTIAAPLYLVIAVGLPALIVSQADRSDPAAAFLGVGVGLGAGFVLDFAALGVAVPPGLIVHRVALLAALGIVAVGRAADDRPALAVGLLAWVIGLALPLAGVI